MRIDDKDRIILDILQRNARVTNKALAVEVGLSGSACHERVRRLERLGIILGYRAVIDDVRKEGKFELWASISTLDLSEHVQREFEEILRATNSIVDAHPTSGEFDWFVHMLSNDDAEWRRFCTELGALGIGRARVRVGIAAQPRRSSLACQK